MSRSWIEVPIDQDVWGVPESGYAPHSFPPEGDDLLFRFDEESFLRVLSALINGAALTYPDTWLQVVWDFLKNVEYPVSLCDAISQAILTCTDVQAALATVIATNPTVQHALRNFVMTDPSIADYVNDAAAQVTTRILSQTELGRNILKPDACDPGFIFNECSTLIGLLDSLTNDLFQSLEVGSNHLERAELLLSGIPGVGILPFDELLSLADDMVENLSEDYNGAYDEAMYDQLRCGLFCRVKDNCTLSINDAFAFYEFKLGQSFPLNPVQGLLGVLQFLDSGDFPGDLIVYGMHLLVLAAMRAGGDYLGVDFAKLGLRITAAGDESDNDWETLCEDCPDDTDCTSYVWDLSTTTTMMGKNTGIYVMAGDVITMTASGSYTYNASGNVVGPAGSNPGIKNPAWLCPSADLRALIAKVGPEGAWHFIGIDGAFTAEATGNIYLNINEQVGDLYYEDNNGTVNAEICVEANMWVKTSGAGEIEQISGGDGGNGAYVVKFMSGTVTGGQNFIWARLRDTSKQMQVTSVTVDMEGGGSFETGAGTFGSYLPGSTASPAEPLIDITNTTPVVGGEYGGIWAATYEPYPYEITIAFNLENR